jgi:hypothetical protein
LCKASGESIDNLFMHCKIATELWSMILQLFGVAWVMSRSVNVGELEGANEQPDIDTNLANGSIVCDVVCLEGTECTQL